MNKVLKEDLAKKITEIFNNTQDQINKLIVDNKFTYFGCQTIDEIKKIREKHDWITQPHERFFKHFDHLSHCPDLTLMTIATIFANKNPYSRSKSLDKYLMSPDEKKAYIEHFDNSAQERIEKQKKADKLYKKIEAEKEKLCKMKDEYRNLVGDDGYYV